MSDHLVSSKEAKHDDHFRLTALEEKVERLSHGITKKQKRFLFLKDPSQVTAIAAVIISLVTTFYSWSRDRRQDEAALEGRFQATLVQLSDLAIKDFELRSRNPESSPGLNALYQWENVENTLWTQEASSILRKLGARASPVETVVVADRLESLGAYQQAEALLSNVNDRSEIDLADKMTVLRELGSLEVKVHKPDSAKDYFTLAITTAQTKATPPEYRSFELYFTEYTWGMNLALARDCEGAKPHISEARSYVSGMALSSEGASNLTARMQTELASYCPPPN